jgi:hypothetical protein
VNSPLYRNDSNEAKNGVRGVPQFEEPLHIVVRFPPEASNWNTHQEFKETNHPHDGENVGNESHDGAKFGVPRIKDGTKEQ